MLRTQTGVQMKGGLEADLLTDEDVEELRTLSIDELWFASDTNESIHALRKAGQSLNGLSRDKLRCYVLLAFGGQTVSEAMAHLEDVWQAGFMPFAQLYQPPDKLIEYSQEWQDLARNWSRPAIMKSIHITTVRGVKNGSQNNKILNDYYAPREVK